MGSRSCPHYSWAKMQAFSNSSHYQLYDKLLSEPGLSCRIACFFNNHFETRQSSDTKQKDIIMERMLNYNKGQNTFAKKKVETARWSRRSTTTKMTSREILDFPDMTENSLKIFFHLHNNSCYYH